MWTRSKRKDIINTQGLLKSIVVNIHHHLSSFFRYGVNTLSESFTKTGPGRKAKMIRRGKDGHPITKWIPRQQEYSSYRKPLGKDARW